MTTSSLKLWSIREKVSEEEWQARLPMAARYRLMALYGLTDKIAGTTREFLNSKWLD